MPAKTGAQLRDALRTKQTNIAGANGNPVSWAGWGKSVERLADFAKRLQDWRQQAERNGTIMRAGGNSNMVDDAVSSTAAIYTNKPHKLDERMRQVRVSPARYQRHVGLERLESGNRQGA